MGGAYRPQELIVIDYVVAHELCHFHHRDHTDAFWNEIDKVMPDFGERKEWLRKNGAGLDVRPLSRQGLQSSETRAASPKRP